MEFLFAYIAGLLALINPCVLPILPVVIAGSLSSSKYGPIALLSGLCLSFTLVGIVIAALGPTLGIDEETVSRTAAAIMVGLGLFLLLSTNSATSSMFDGTANVANNLLAKVPTTGLRNQFVGGVLLGAAWAPCIGPTLGGALALAYEQSHIGYATSIMFLFSLGVATIMLSISYGTRNFVTRFNTLLRYLASNASAIIGCTFIFIGMAMFFKAHLLVEAKLLEMLPEFVIDFSTRF